MQPLEAGDPRVIGEYRLLRRIGAGGMGRVYLGRSPGGRTVAVKAVHPRFATDAEFRVRFRREVEAARRVGGAWTAPVLDADPDAAVPWVATGYVAGPSLQQAVADHGPMPGRTVRALGAGLAEALAAVHALGLVHRDVKPSNVLLTLDGPRLIDFGIARATDGTTGITSTGASIGSPGYMSPEQVLGRGGVAAPSDVFSLGAVLAYAATGMAPFPGDSSAALLYNVVHEEPELAALTDGELRELIAACLAKRAAGRPTPDTVVRALAGAAGAAALTRAGWLPGALVEQVSRSAVALLDMEGEAATPAHPASPDASADDGAPASGLVPFPEAAVQGVDAPATRPSVAAGTPDGGATASPGAPQRDASAAGPPSAPPGEPSVPSRASPPDAQAGDTRRGGFAVSASATTGPPPGAGNAKRSARQLSCTLVLSVAGALAAALLTLGIVFDLMPGGGTDQNAGDSAEPPAAADSPSSDEPEGDEPTSGEPTPDDQPDGGTESGGGTGGAGTEPGAVPAEYLDTWKGQLTTDDGLPAGILTVTVAQGEPGEQIVTGRFVRAITGDRCRAEFDLRSATEEELRVVGSGFDGEGGCTAEGGSGVFRLQADGGLRFVPTGEAAGNPAGTLQRS